MSSYVRRPTFANQLAATKNRVNTLERQLQNGSPQPSGYAITWSYDGEVSDFVDVVSHPGIHPRGGYLLQVRATLNTAGATSTIISVRHKGTQFATITLTAGNIMATAYMYKWCGGVDRITYVILEAGAGATDLTLVADFDR